MLILQQSQRTVGVAHREGLHEGHGGLRLPRLQLGKSLNYHLLSLPLPVLLGFELHFMLDVQQMATLPSELVTLEVFLHQGNVYFMVLFCLLL